MGVGGVGIFNWCLMYYFIVFIVAARSMRKCWYPVCSGFSCRNWRAVVYEIVGGRNREYLSQEYYKKELPE